MLRILLITLFMMYAQTDSKRVLAIYTKSTEDASYKEQLKILSQDKAGLDERDIQVKTFTYSTANAAQFNKHHIKTAFAVTLTGKDGGEKFRDTQPVTLQKLYGIIDAMPMRQSEMKNNHK